MAKAGDSFTVTLKDAHLDWGTKRYTYTRDRIKGESYVQVSSNNATKYDIKKGNVYNCSSEDGKFNHTLRASGNQNNPSYAKQLHSDGDLKALGTWLHKDCSAVAGNKVQVTFTSPNDISLKFIP